MTVFDSPSLVQLPCTKPSVGACIFVCAGSLHMHHSSVDNSMSHKTLYTEKHTLEGWKCRHQHVLLGVQDALCRVPALFAHS